jgi:Mrp family chromosome partitioning ATPase
VDGNLARGYLHELLNVSAAPCLADLLPSPTQPLDVTQNVGVENLIFIGSGQCSKHGGDLLMSCALESLIARWRADYDFVIIDTRSMSEADDANTVAPRVDGVLFIVGRRQDGARAVREALRVLGQRHAKIFGLVLNRAV